jgi:hypothetical protein
MLSVLQIKHHVDRISIPATEADAKEGLGRRVKYFSI